MNEDLLMGTIGMFGSIIVFIASPYTFISNINNLPLILMILFIYLLGRGVGGVKYSMP
jgi:hypothetical protein